MPRKLMIFSCAFLCIYVCAFAEERITITTYYPSPYGSYNELQTNKLGVGDTNRDGSITPADQPNRDGDIRLRPQDGSPVSWSATNARGQLAYSASNDEFYYSNGSAWMSLGGPGSWTCTLVRDISSTAYCLAGYTLITGGCEGLGNLGYPIDNGWQCAGGLVARAWCCQ